MAVADAANFSRLTIPDSDRNPPTLAVGEIRCGPYRHCRILQITCDQHLPAIAAPLGAAAGRKVDSGAAITQIAARREGHLLPRATS